MSPTIYEVMKIHNGKLSVMAKPVCGEWVNDEFRGLKMLGISKIVSLLEKNEALEVGLSEEKELCLKNDIEFENFPIRDRGLPNESAARKLVIRLLKEISSGKHVVIHCRAGIGRTGIISGAILKETGLDSNSAIAAVSRARGVPVPDTLEQEQWLENY